MSESSDRPSLPSAGVPTSPPQTTRRDFLASAAAAALGTTAGAAASPPAEGQRSAKFQPESFWTRRMQPPEDGKRYGWFIDTRRCIGCHGCEVSCKAENDVPLGHFIRQTIYADVGEYPKVARLFLPVACQHCEDAPCIKACPCGALHKGEGGTVLVDYDRCSGHGTCVEVCPYGAIYLDPVAKQAVKCHNCVHRLEHGMQPACVPTCPAEALHFGDLNDPDSWINRAMADAREQGETLHQLRPEKGTRPRAWYAGRAAVEIEHRVPTEGHSFGTDTYDIYRWKERDSGADRDEDR